MRAPGVRATGRPATGAPMIISSPGALRMSGVTPGRLHASRSMKMRSRPTSTAMITASRRSLPRECARSLRGKRRRQSGSGPPWPLSEPRFSLAGGSAQHATNGTCRSVTYVTVATGSVPRRECSRAVSRIPAGTSRTGMSRTPTTRRQSTCAESRRMTSRRRSCHSSAPPGRRGAPALRSGVTRLEGPRAEARKGSSLRAAGRGVAQQRGLVSVWLRPLAAAPAWCAAPSLSACRRGPLGARHL